MPTYKNDTDHPVYWANRTWTPGEEKSVSFFVPSDMGLTKTSDDPVPKSQILFAEDVVVAAGSSVDIEIPYSKHISIEAATEGNGIAELMMGDKIIKLDEKYGASFQGLLWERLGKISISSSAGATVCLLIQEEVKV